ncbi:MAG: SLBB domain-containing protein, partial [Gemmatimonadales bacterium]
MKVLLLAALLATAQTPTPTQVQQALAQQPGLGDVLRSRIRESGLSADQIRARLRASGYPATLLDAYLGLGTGGSGLAGPSAQELEALQALGLPPISTEFLSPDTGLVRRAALPPSDVFGVDVFRRTTTQFLPLLAGPVPADYKLGPGDNLVLILTGDVELAYQLQVTREGFVLIPQVGQIHVANLTLEQLRNLLYARLGRVYSGVRHGANATTRFDVTVASVRANQVYVVGEVAQPGAYQISSLGTVLTALYAGGGVTERANLRAIEVQRLGRTVATLDLYDYLLEGNTRADIRLETGDVVFVPLHGPRVRVTGAVVRPAVYELAEGETLADVLAAAGGFRPEAALERVAVQRILPVRERTTPNIARQTIVIPLAAPAPGARHDSGSRETGDGLSVTVPPFVLRDGDVVQVDALDDAADQYTVAITGMVQQPGTYPWRSGMTLRDLVLLARGPKIGADLREAEVARLPA